tara:strand:+ start:658 stop:1272 length:615 start_codon:yes stop_codon:yes gene_type:complete
MKSLKHHEYVSIGSQKASHRIILLHGWGADVEDLLPLGEEIFKNVNIDFEIISLRAPNLHPESIGRQWYGLFPANWDEAEFEVNKLVSTLHEFGELDIPLNRTILLGFSQGAAMAIHAGNSMNLGLIISCSGYPHPTWIPEINCPVLISHGLGDEIVPVNASKEIYEKIKKVSRNDCYLHEFKGMHEIDPNFIEIIKDKINKYF